MTDKEKKASEKIGLFSNVASPYLFSAMEKVIDSGLLLLDRNFRCLFINERAKSIFELAPGKKLTDEKEMSLLGPLFEEFQAGDEDLFEKELRINLRWAENEKTVKTLSTPIIGADGKLGYIVCLWDLTSTKEKERLQSEFVGHVSHEMRTPLTVMKEFTSILLDGLGGKLNSRQEEYLGIIHNNIERLDRIVSTLLDVSRLQAGKVKLVCEIANITRLMKHVVYMLTPQAEKKMVKLTCKSLGRLPPARIDVDKITQVLINLLANALKYTPAGGIIDVSAKNVDNVLAVSVSDTGMGIPLEDQKRVFDKFFQIGLKPGPGAKGVGLGLAITKQIVIMHGGKIWIDSVPGKGSTFTFTVPCVKKIADLPSYIDECIDFSKISGKHFTLLRICISNMKKLEKTGTKKEVIGTMKNIIGNELRKATDSDPILIKDSLFVGLPNTNRKQANTLKERLISVFSFKVPVVLKLGLADYPGDAGTSEEIIKHAISDSRREVKIG